jgi:hypothetical protein
MECGKGIAANPGKSPFKREVQDLDFGVGRIFQHAEGVTEAAWDMSEFTGEVIQQHSIKRVPAKHASGGNSLGCQLGKSCRQ